MAKFLGVAGKIKPQREIFLPRSIIPEKHPDVVQRAFKLAGGVAIFSESTAIALIEALKPDIYVKGGDCTIETLPETSAVQA